MRYLRVPRRIFGGALIAIGVLVGAQQPLVCAIIAFGLVGLGIFIFGGF